MGLLLPSLHCLQLSNCRLATSGTHPPPSPPTHAYAGHLKKRLPGAAGRSGEPSSAKRLRALAGLALRGDSEEEDEAAEAELAAAGRGGGRRGRYEDSEEEDEEALLRSLHSSKTARTGSGAGGALSPRSARAGSAGARRAASGGGSPSRRHVTRAATGSLRPRHFELEGLAGSDEEQYEPGLDAEERYLLSARQHARGGGISGALRGRPGGSDSSQHTRSTTEHCSGEGVQQLGTAAAAAAAAAQPFFRSLSASGSTGGPWFAPSWFGCSGSRLCLAACHLPVPGCHAAQLCLGGLAPSRLLRSAAGTSGPTESCPRSSPFLSAPVPSSLVCRLPHV